MMQKTSIMSVNTKFYDASLTFVADAESVLLAKLTV